MAFNQKDVDWTSKEKRDMLFRFVNGGSINNPDADSDKLLEEGKYVIDKIFTLYPDQLIIPEASTTSSTQFKIRDDFNVPSVPNCQTGTFPIGQTGTVPLKQSTVFPTGQGTSGSKIINKQ